MKNRMKVEFLNSVITQLMMRMKAASVKRFGKILLSFLFFLQTLVIPLSVAGGVLCISESHIAIEFRQATNDCHNDTISSKNFKIETEYHQDGCADIPLIQHKKNLTENFSEVKKNEARRKGHSFADRIAEKL